MCLAGISIYTADETEKCNNIETILEDRNKQKWKCRRHFEIFNSVQTWYSYALIRYRDGSKFLLHLIIYSNFGIVHTPTRQPIRFCQSIAFSLLDFIYISFSWFFFYSSFIIPQRRSIRMSFTHRPMEERQNSILKYMWVFHFCSATDIVHHQIDNIDSHTYMQEIGILLLSQFTLHSLTNALLPLPKNHR